MNLRLKGKLNIGASSSRSGKRRIRRDVEKSTQKLIESIERPRTYAIGPKEHIYPITESNVTGLTTLLTSRWPLSQFSFHTLAVRELEITAPNLDVALEEFFAAILPPFVPVAQLQPYFVQIYLHDLHPEPCTT